MLLSTGLERCARLLGMDTRIASLPAARRAGHAASASYRRWLLGLAGILAALAVAAFAVDLPVATWCRSPRLPKDLMRLFDFAEAFAHGTGVAALLVVVLVLDPGLRLPWPGRSVESAPGAREFLRMIAATFTGGLVVDVIKALVERVRPRAADLASLGSAWSTFGDAALAGDVASRSDLASFPSGHAAVAAGFAAALAWRYPHGSILFAVIAILAAAQRIVTSAHYPSDVACGAGIGLACAALCLGARNAAVMERPPDAC